MEGDKNSGEHSEDKESANLASESGGDDSKQPEEQTPDNSRRNAIMYLVAFVLVILAATVLTLLALRDDGPESVDQTQDQQFVNNKAEIDGLSFLVVDTNQILCFDNAQEIECPLQPGEFFGQDAQYQGNGTFFTDNGDGTISDSVTGLTWQKSPGEKASYTQATDGADALDLAGYDDWRVPTIKELYSLIFFSGTDPDPLSQSTEGITPFIDTRFFDFEYGDTTTGSRIIDSQWVTSNRYVSTVFNGQECFFGVNFADGRIKCYPVESRNSGYFVRYVRGAEYGNNDFADNQDGTISDNSSGLIWQKSDSDSGMSWSEALDTCENSSLAGRSDWRLPSAKELHSIVDYSRSPDTTDSPALDPMFDSTSKTNEAGQKDWPFYWTSTTHKSTRGGETAVYISFGRGMGNMPEFGGWIDVHGAGSQRSDPKSGDPSQYSQGRGPQGDAVRINNFVRCVSDNQES